MRILHTIKNFDFGGAENHVRELANELINQGNEVYLLTVSGGRQLGLLNRDIKLYKACLLCNSLLFNVIKLICIVKKHHIEVIHAHQRLPILSSSIAGYLLGVPVIVTIHGRTKYDLRKTITRKIPSAFIFVSQAILKRSRYNYQLAVRSVVIPNGISQVSQNSSFIKYGIGYVCRTNSRHAHIIYLLMEVLSLLLRDFNTLSLYIYGEGKELVRIRKKADAINEKIGRKIISINGFVKNIGDIGALPELVLGVGRVAIEAAARGCSVISANSNRTGELITTENYPFYRENNYVNINGIAPTSGSLYDLISQFFRDRDTNRKKSLELTGLINNDHNIKNIAGYISSIYNLAVNNGK